MTKGVKLFYYTIIMSFLFYDKIKEKEAPILQLIIAEKPSLARNIVAGIEQYENIKLSKKNGFYSGGDYAVTWAFGHLFSLADIEDYQPNPDGNNRWTMKNLPCFPEEFKFNLRRDGTKQVDSGVQKQFNIIKDLCNNKDVDTIINAGDADREGEIIVRLCVQQALKDNKKFMRLWLPDQTPQTIKKALEEIKDESEYQNLADEGFARTYIDWLYGVNLTRYATLKTGTLLRVGRVIVPIVKAIYDRDMAIRNFVPEKYFAIISKEETNGEAIELISKEKFNKDEEQKALDLCTKYNASDAIVTSVKNKKDKLNPGKLFSLSKLQNLLGKKLKMPMEESLTILQKLYEEGYVTYPRTNSEYLAEAEQGKIKQIISSVAKMGYPVEFKFKKTIFDDKKIESHSALTPTYKIPSPKNLSEKEMQVYSTIFRRFVAVFCSEDCIVQRSEITINVGGYEDFTLKGTIILEKGWTKYDDYTQKDKILPKLNKGDKVNIDFKPTEKETSPPRHYTIETLNNYLKNPFKEDKAAAQNGENENDEEDYKAIFEGLELGTEATRTGIIDNARKSKYINLKKDVYTILPDGEYLIESLGRMGISMDKYKTSEMGKALKKVYRGEFSIKDSVNLTEKEIREVFNIKTESSPETDTDDGFFGDIIGKCPLCENQVMRGKFGYVCMGYKDGCKFNIRSPLCGRTISISNAKTLIETGKTVKIQGFISKAGKNFDAALKLEEGKVVFDF